MAPAPPSGLWLRHSRMVGCKAPRGGPAAWPGGKDSWGNREPAGARLSQHHGAGWGGGRFSPPLS